jgi:hypothetical protein
MSFIEEILELSPPVALTVALNLVGVFLKKSPINDWLIPFILMVLGAVVYPFICETAKVSYQVTYPVILNAIYGLCIGGLAVGIHASWKSFLHAKSGGDTRLFRRVSNEASTKIPHPV